MYKSSPDESIIASRKIGESNSIDVSRQLISEKFKSYSSFSEDIKKHITLLIADRRDLADRLQMSHKQMKNLADHLKDMEHKSNMMVFFIQDLLDQAQMENNKFTLN